MGRVHKLLNDPDFKNKITNYFDLIKTNLLNEYSSKYNKNKSTEELKGGKTVKKSSCISAKNHNNDKNMKSTNRSRRTGSQSALMKSFGINTKMDRTPMKSSELLLEGVSPTPTQ